MMKVKESCFNRNNYFYFYLRLISKEKEKGNRRYYIIYIITVILECYKSVFYINDRNDKRFGNIFLEFYVQDSLSITSNSIITHMEFII